MVRAIAASDDRPGLRRSTNRSAREKKVGILGAVDGFVSLHSRDPSGPWLSIRMNQNSRSRRYARRTALSHHARPKGRAPSFSRSPSDDNSGSGSRESRTKSSTIDGFTFPD